MSHPHWQPKVVPLVAEQFTENTRKASMAISTVPAPKLQYNSMRLAPYGTPVTQLRGVAGMKSRRVQKLSSIMDHLAVRTCATYEPTYRQSYD